ncbi:MAG: putative Ig domain-containing protein [Acidobacteriota bacterium]|nr:putative Ig domain-containing protein [Acidobacteriota bacterium]
MRGAVLPLLLSICIGTLQAQQSSPTVWTASSLARIGQNSPAGSSNNINLYEAKDETYSFQIGVQNSSGTLTVNNVTTSGLIGPGGATISGSDIVLYREQYVSVPALPGYLSGGPNAPGSAGMYPDGLIPFIDPETGVAPVGGSIHSVPFDVVAGTNQVLWVDVHVPVGSPAGDYNGAFTISTNSGSSVVTCNLQVWNFTLPKAPALISSVQATHNRNDLMARELLRNRQSPAWSISSPALESQYIDQYGLNSVGIFMSTGWYNGNCQGSNPTPSVAMPSSAQFASAYAAHDPRLVVYNFLADEVYPEQSCTGTYPTLVQWARNMHLANSNLMSLVSISPEASFTSPLYNDGTGRTAVDIWTILPMMYQQNTAEIQTREAAGDQMWLYNVLVQDNYSPKQNLNWGSLDWRLSLGYLSANVGFTGWQQWAVDCWGSDPWHSGAPAGCSNPAVPGDGMSMYPGADVGLVGYAPSIRMKWSRDGVNDYEYVHILKTLGQGAWALSQIDLIAHDFANWTRDYTQLEVARNVLGNKIDQLSGGTVNAPSITSPTSAQASAGQSFRYQITGTNTPTSFNATGLPASLAVNQTTGVISGTPNAAGTYAVSISAGNKGGTGSAVLTLIVPATPMIATTSLPNGAQNAAYSATLMATGGTTPYSWAVTAGTLPAGLSLAAGTGVISGTPTASGTSTFTVQVTDANLKKATQALSLVISAINPASSGGGVTLLQSAQNGTAGTAGAITTVTLSATGAGHFLAVQINNGDATVASVSDTQKNTFAKAASLKVGNQDIEIWYAMNITGGADTVTVTGNSNTSYIWAAASEYSGVATTNALDAKTSASGSGQSASSGNTLTTTQASEVVIGIADWYSCTANTIPTPGTGYTSRQTASCLANSDETVAQDSVLSSTGAYSVTATGANPSDSTWIVVGASFKATGAAPAAPAIATTSLPNGAQTTAYNATLTAIGGMTPYTWAVTAGTLPAGLSLAVGTGVISGTPSTSGTSNFTVQLTDGNSRKATRALSVVIGAGGGGGTALLQSAQTGAAGTAGTSATVSFINSTGAGHFLAVQINNGDATVASVSDTQKNTFAKAASLKVGNQDIEIWYAMNIAGGADTVTVKGNSNTSYIWAAASEYSGVATANALDAKTSAWGNGQSASSGNTLITTQANEVAIGIADWYSCTANTVPMAGTGYTGRQTASCLANSDETITQDSVLPSAGTYSIAATGAKSSDTAWIVLGASFKK